MGLFPCSECAAKDAREQARAEHVAYLQGLVKDLQTKLLEVATPGANARIAAAERLATTPTAPPREPRKKPEPDLERKQLAPLPGHD